MTELRVLWAWVNARIGKAREEYGDDAGFTVLEWVAIAGVVVAAAVIIATMLVGKAKGGAAKINLQ